MKEKVKLIGGPEKSVTWVWLENRHLKVEFYDFSETAQSMFGNDIAYTITVAHMETLLGVSGQKESSILQWMSNEFKSYFGIKQWLEENKIEFRIERESWA